MFYHWYDMESNYDGGNVKISTDDGATWTLITPITPYPGTAWGLNSEAVYNGNSGGWVLAAFYLSMYDGQDVMFKFHFGSDSSVVYLGWDIDDVYVGEPEDRGRPIALTTEKIVSQFKRDSDAETRLDRMDGYSLYRGFADDEENFEDWDLIVSALQDTTYEDTSWHQVQVEGEYKYCIRVEYTGGVLSEPAFSNVIVSDAPPVLYGDVTGDGVVDAYDAAILLQYSVGMNPVGAPLPWTWQLISGDVSGDSCIDAYDAALVLQYSVGIINTFPVETREDYVYPVAEIKLTQAGQELIISAQGDLYSLMLDFNFDLESQQISIKIPDLLFYAYQNKMALASAYPLNGEICRISLSDADNLKGTSVWGSVNESRIQLFVDQLPEVTLINAIYPNPFNPVTNIMFSLCENDNVKITVYNLKGQKVAELLNKPMIAGVHHISWDAEAAASGIYFLNFKTNSVQSIHKLMLLK
jgi:hypothetical protein